MTKPLPRRAVLTGATALAAGAAVNVAAIAATRAASAGDNLSFGDAPILAAPCPLVAEYHRLLPAYAAAFVEWARLQMRATRIVDLKYGAHRRMPDNATSEEHEAWFRGVRTRGRRLSRELKRQGARAASDVMENLGDEIRALNERAEAEVDRANPMALLRVRVLMMTFEAMPLGASYAGGLCIRAEDGGEARWLWVAAVDATGQSALVDAVDAILMAGATETEDEAGDQEIVS